MNIRTLVQNLHCIVVLSLMLVVGCSGSDRPATYPVSGSVLYNGEPVAGASVGFWTEGAPRASTGVTNAEGKFQLSMYDANDGALAGSQLITVSKIEAGAAGEADPTKDMDNAAAMADMMANAEKGGGAKGPKSLIPKVYSRKDTTTLKETVSADGENTFILQLTD
ncbi:MAG: DUF4198 domain-containing protein [Fuerstiella sp.]|nr:DUF4198 domain-containing protein [Fuerstiella sp.]MCP4854637.1 DUF4198 domain-containing protein [Fuerstiella sp.]